MMRWIPFVLLGLVAVGCATTHSNVPRKERAAHTYRPEHPQVPERPDLVLLRRVDVSAPPAIVFDIIVDVPRWPSWDPTVTRTEAEGLLSAPGDRFQQDPRGYEVSTVVLEVEADRYIRWRGVTKDGTVGVRSFLLLPTDDGGTTVVLREEFSKWTMRMFGWTGMGFARHFDRTLEALGRRAEAAARGASTAVHAKAR